MADIKVPSQILFPPPRNQEEAELFRMLDDYFNQLRQTLIDIVETLP